MIRAAILGGTGYGGMELLRYLLGHPEVEVVALTSRSQEGLVAARHPHLRGFTDLRYSIETPELRRELGRTCDVVFSAKPHAVAAADIPALLEAEPTARVIDLSGDYRLKDPALYPTWYKIDHPRPDVLATAHYGLPECGGRDGLAEARLVANPGCHASASILALWPLARAGAIEGPVSVVSVTGSSGGGAHAKQGSHHPERFTNYKAYRMLHHQHVPEIVQQLGEVAIDFVPHSAPISRGIHVTAFVPTGARKADEVRALYEAAYADAPFVRLVESAEVRAIVGTNFADVAVGGRDGMALITLAIDNLGKGMAGTAVQNMNLMFGLDERAGLDRPGAGL